MSGATSRVCGSACQRRQRALHLARGLIQIAAETDVGRIPMHSSRTRGTAAGGDAIAGSRRPPPCCRLGRLRPRPPRRRPYRGAGAARWRRGPPAARPRTLPTASTMASAVPASTACSRVHQSAIAAGASPSCGAQHQQIERRPEPRLLEQPQRALAARLLQPRLQRIHLAHARAPRAAESSRAPRLRAARGRRPRRSRSISCQRCGGSDSIASRNRPVQQQRKQECRRHRLVLRPRAHRCCADPCTSSCSTRLPGCAPR